MLNARVLLYISAAVQICFCLADLLKMFKGHIAQLLRHPCGASVIDDLYAQANPKQQAAMAAEMYGREFVLFSGEAKRLPDLLKELPAAKQKAVLRNMAQHAIPIMEKALVDPPIVHRSLPLPGPPFCFQHAILLHPSM